MKTLTAKITFTMQRASKEVCDKFGKPYGTIEVIDNDGIRCCFAETEQQAIDQLHDDLYGTLVTDFEIDVTDEEIDLEDYV